MLIEQDNSAVLCELPADSKPWPKMMLQLWWSTMGLECVRLALQVMMLPGLCFPPLWDAPVTSRLKSFEDLKPELLPSCVGLG
ncbi:hypothetical protein chiPu_0021302 [Chiloscyllium punctatum]|uniref:Uncharacterized protein n=1 Tax=Chiloscyllium punctatum TaxID=137246 RepID=A0A401RPT2_CHIPU|nr:hypothetical protein [Chiloscyllium punctatum]